MPATIADVAKNAGVSIRTASRVLNKSPLVNETTRARVEAAMQQLGFSPNSRARALSFNRSFLIGLIHDEVNALVLDHMQRGIIDVCTGHRVELVIHPVSSSDPAVLDDVAAFLQRSRVDGVIVGPPMSEVAGLTALLTASRVPAVAAAAMPLNGYDRAFRYEERNATARIARHLLDLGHTRFGLVRGPQHYRSAHERASGFIEALFDANVAIDPEHIVVGDYRFASGVEAGQRILNAAHPPTAIFASNDYMAAGVLKAAAQRGIDVPGELSVVGFDDSEIGPMLHPALTTIRRPIRELARRMTEQLFEVIDGQARAAASVETVPLELVIRESTQAIRSAPA